MPLTHPKVSTKPDNPDSTLVNPSDWNADHTGEILESQVPATIARTSELMKYRILIPFALDTIPGTSFTP
jgi:hypothetical protein